MNYFDAVFKAIDFIECNLTEKVSLDEIAYNSGFSLYHFHRIFLAMTGETMKSYQRKRRLTQAAFELSKTHKKVIDIAFDYQFETPESFARAFRRMYSMNPSTFRKKETRLTWFVNMPRISRSALSHYTDNMTLEPQIVFKDKFTVMGIEKKCVGQQSFKDLWNAFLPRVNEIDKICEFNNFYGVTFRSPDNNSCIVNYMACVPVSHNDEIPKGMSSRQIPPMHYAVFQHNGLLGNLHITYKYIYSTWMYNNKLSIVDAPDFEFYDHRFKVDSEDSVMFIYIPIEIENNNQRIISKSIKANVF